MKIACGLGKRATGKYSLSLATPGEKARQFEGMPCAPTFRRLEWLGFVSLAEKHSVFYLDNVRLEREK